MEGHAGEKPAEIPARRATTLKRLRGRPEGDLDNIVAKALKKRPSERYGSAEAMADDLRRFLALEPVTAVADSMAYRAGKFLRRRRGAVAAAGLPLVAALVGTAGIVLQAREAQKQRDEAQTQLTRATAANDFMNVLLNVAAPAGRKFNVGELLDQGTLLIDKQFAADNSLRADMLAIMGRISCPRSVWTGPRPFWRAVAIARESGDPGLQARALCPLAYLHIAKGERAAGEAMMAGALARLPDEPRHALTRAACLVNQSAFGFFSGEAEPMVRNATAALDLLDRTPAPARLMRIEALASVAYGHYLARHNRQAEEAYARLWEMLEKTGLERTGMAATVLNNWSLVHYQGDIARAEVLCRRAVELRRSIESPESVVPTATFNHAGALLRLGAVRRGPAALRGDDRDRRRSGRASIRFDAMMELADLHIEKGDLARAAGSSPSWTPSGIPPVRPLEAQQLAYYEARLALARGDYPEARARFAGVAERFEKRKSKITMNVMALHRPGPVPPGSGRGRRGQEALGARSPWPSRSWRRTRPRTSSAWPGSPRAISSGRTGRPTGRGPRTAARWTTFSAPSARTTPLPSPAGSTPRSAVRRPAGRPASRRIRGPVCRVLPALPPYQ